MTGQAVRFAVVGVVNTGTYYGSYLCLRLVMPYLAAHVLAFVLSLVGSFFLNAVVTYRTRPTWRKFLLFPLTAVTNFVVLTAGVAALVQAGGMDEKAAPLVAATVAVPVTFVVARAVMLGHRRDGDPESSGRGSDADHDPAADGQRRTSRSTGVG